MALPLHLPPVSAGATRIVSLDLTDDLDSSETLTGTPTVSEISTTDLTLGNKQVNSGSITVLGRTVTAGKAIQFTTAGQVAGTVYSLSVSCATTTTPAETLTYTVIMPCV